MEISPHSRRNKARDWTLSLSGESMVALHFPLVSAETRWVMPEGWRHLAFEDVYYLSHFTGTLRTLSFFAGEEITARTPCSLTALPVLCGEIRGWWVLQASLSAGLVSDYARRFLSLPLAETPPSIPAWDKDGGVQVRFPAIPDGLLPEAFSGKRRRHGFKAMPGTLDAFLTTQPNLIYASQQGPLLLCPLYLPPVTLKRVEPQGSSANQGIIAHDLENWEMIAWRPNRMAQEAPIPVL